MTHDEAWLLKEKYDGTPSDGFAEDLLRLQRGEPLAYVIGWVPFLGTRITLDSRPLIPRAETEHWVERAIAALMQEDRPLRILDLCAGSGCIGIAVLQAIPRAHVDFVEIDTAHHATIRANLELNGIDPERAVVRGGDLFACVDQHYDHILTNPPYIDPDLDRTEPGVRDFEPHQALYGGTGGMTYIERIIHEAPRYLAPHGALLIEHEPEQTAAIARMGRETGFETEVWPDQFGVERTTRLVLH